MSSERDLLAQTVPGSVPLKPRLKYRIEFLSFHLNVDLANLAHFFPCCRKVRKEGRDAECLSSGFLLSKS